MGFGLVRIYMMWAILPFNLPLLISLPVMKKLSITIRYSDDKAWLMVSRRPSENLECHQTRNIQKNLVSHFHNTKAPGELVAVDLQIRHHKTPILYVVYYCTGFCTGTIVPDKTAYAAIQGLRRCWYSAQLTIIRTCLSANWKNFVGDEFKTFLQRFVTIHCTTQLYQPEPNGKIERVHFIIDNNIRDLMNSFIKMH